MKTRNHFFFDVSTIFQQTDCNQEFVKGFSEFIEKVGQNNVSILSPQYPNELQTSLENKLASLNLTDKIRYVRTQKEIADYVNQSYTSNCYLFLNQFNVEKNDFHKPTALIQIDKNNDLLPEKDVITLKDFRPLLTLF